MKKRLLFSLLQFICTYFLYSQVDSNIKNPADKIFSAPPEISSFHKHTFFPVNLYTGKVNVDIPIYQVSSGDIQVPIGLSYDTGGNKLNEIASSVGLGWNLNGGGSVIRVVKDVPDNQLEIDTHGPLNPTNFTPNFNTNYLVYDIEYIGYHRRYYDRDFSRNDRGESYNPQVNLARRFSNHIDSSPDLYHVAAPNLNAKFIILSDAAIEKPSNATNGLHNLYNRSFRALFLDNQGLKMNNSLLKYVVYDTTNILNSHPSGPNTDFLQDYHEAKYLETFEITNTNGLVYKFEIGDVSEIDNSSVGSAWELTSSQYTKEVVSWNLKSITNPVTGKNVVFEYDIYQQTTVLTDTNVTIPASVFPGDIISQTPTPIEATAYFNALPIPATIDVVPTPINDISRTVYPRKTRIKKIIFDKGYVDFKYNDANRLDYPDEALSQIMIKNNDDKLIKRFQFVYEYFNSKENCNQRECYKLKLKELRQFVNNKNQIEDQTYLNKYTFDYNTNTLLPNAKHSLEKDYLGFYNRNGAGYFSPDVINSFEYTRIDNEPRLYFYPNQYELSVLPFKRKDITNQNDYADIYSWAYSIEPDYEGSIATMLKKITYPTGGSLELFYENHQFHFQGFDYESPGLRIRKQIIDDGEGNIQSYDYSYKDINGKSSGSFTTIPVYGYVKQYSDFANGIPEPPYFVFDKFLNPHLGYELTHGGFIGYSRVIEEQVGNGKKVYYYTSPKDFPVGRVRYGSGFSSDWNQKLDYLFKNSAFASRNFIDLDIRRGKLIKTEVFDNDSIILLKEERAYSYKKFDSISTRYITDIGYGVSRSRRFLNYVDFEKDLSNLYVAELIEDSKIFVERNLETNLKKEFYNFSGTTLKEEVSRTYDSNLPFVKKKISLTSKGQLKTVDYKYPFNIDSNETNKMTSLNMVKSPVEVTNSENGKSTTIKNNFRLINNFPYLSSSVSKKENNDENLEISYELYDTSNGNLLQYKVKNNFPITLLWGYDKTLPIAKIENIKFNQLNSKFDDEYDETVLILNALSSQPDKTFFNIWIERLRNLIKDFFPNAQITTYTYDPLIGIKSITDPRGRTVYYYYDDFNRLQYVKDHEGNVLSENKYKYKN